MLYFSQSFADLQFKSLQPRKSIDLNAQLADQNQHAKELKNSLHELQEKMHVQANVDHFCQFNVPKLNL